MRRGLGSATTANSGHALAALPLSLVLQLSLLLCYVPTQVIGYDFSWAPPKDKPAPGYPQWMQTLLKNLASIPTLKVVKYFTQPLHPAEGAGPNEEAFAGNTLFRRRRIYDELGDDVAGDDSVMAGRHRRRDDPALVALDVTRCSLKDSNAWGLSYDDGPGVYTPTVLAGLQSHNKNASFFVIGSRVFDQPDILHKVDAAGMHIGIHTWSHWPLPSLSTDQIVAELVYGARAIYEVTGKVPRYFRPPYGARDDRLRAIAKNLGLTLVVWSADTKDWQIQSAPKIVDIMKTLFNSAPSNAISLEHDLWVETANAAPPFLDILAQHGKTPMDVLHCLGRTDAYFDPAERAGFYNIVISVGGKVVIPTSSTTSLSSTSTSTSSSKSSLPSSSSSSSSTSTKNSSDSSTTSKSAPSPLTRIDVASSSRSHQSKDSLQMVVLIALLIQLVPM